MFVSHGKLSPEFHFCQQKALRIDWNTVHVSLTLVGFTTLRFCKPNNFSPCNYRPQTKFVKVMLLHVSVILSIGGVSRPILRERLRGLAGGGPRPRWGVCIPACTEADPPPQQTANAADGTHPTVMHSCIYLKISLLIFILKFYLEILFYTTKNMPMSLMQRTYINGKDCER